MIFLPEQLRTALFALGVDELRFTIQRHYEDCLTNESAPECKVAIAKQCWLGVTPVSKRTRKECIDDLVDFYVKWNENGVCENFDHWRMDWMGDPAQLVGVDVYHKRFLASIEERIKTQVFCGTSIDDSFTDLHAQAIDYLTDEEKTRIGNDMALLTAAQRVVLREFVSQLLSGLEG